MMVPARIAVFNGCFSFNPGWHLPAVKGNCKSNGVELDAEEFKKMVMTLSNYNKKEIYCTNVMNAWGGIIEGVIEGRRFSFKFMNPSECNTPETNEVSRILNLLETDA